MYKYDQYYLFNEIVHICCIQILSIFNKKSISWTFVGVNKIKSPSLALFLSTVYQHLLQGLFLCVYIHHIYLRGPYWKLNFTITYLRRPPLHKEPWSSGHFRSKGTWFLFRIYTNFLLYLGIKVVGKNWVTENMPN